MFYWVYIINNINYQNLVAGLPNLVNKKVIRSIILSENMSLHGYISLFVYMAVSINKTHIWWFSVDIHTIYDFKIAEKIIKEFKIKPNF